MLEFACELSVPPSIILLMLNAAMIAILQCVCLCHIFQLMTGMWVSYCACLIFEVFVFVFFGGGCCCLLFFVLCFFSFFLCFVLLKIVCAEQVAKSPPSAWIRVQNSSEQCRPTTLSIAKVPQQEGKMPEIQAIWPESNCSLRLPTAKLLLLSKWVANLAWLLP